MTILVTGASGFMGGHLCRKLSRIEQVIGVSRRVPADEASTGEGGSNLRFRRADLARGLSVPEEIDVIVHAAARVPDRTNKIADYVYSNVLATQQLIDFAIQKRVKLFVYMSAISIYGRISSRCVDENTPITDPGPYGMTKYIGELLLKERESDIPSIILRLPAVVGPGMRTGWLIRTYKALLGGDQLHIYNGDSPYNMVHVENVFDIILGVLGGQYAESNVFTIGCKDPKSILEIVGRMRRHTGSQSVVHQTTNDSTGYTISTAKAERVLGFQPSPGAAILRSFLEEGSKG